MIGICTRRIRLFLVCLISLAGAFPASGATLSLSNAPLYLKTTLAPNIYLTLDDSGSMAFGYMPDNDPQGHSMLNDASSDRYKSHSFNAMYYDPAITYKPPLDKDGNRYPDATFASAWKDGFHHGRGTVDLATAYQAPTSGYSGFTTANGYPSGAAHRAYYYNYDPVGTGCASPGISNDACYVRVVLPPGQEQNFANWFSYYRLRVLAAKSAVTRAFAQLGHNVRVAGQNLNDTANQLNPASNAASVAGVQLLQPFTGTARADWFNWLIDSGANGGTPLRDALNRVGQYFQTSGVNSPYAEDPGNQDGTEYACRQNFSVVMTDGLWNGYEGPNDSYLKDSHSTPIADADETAGPSISDPAGDTYQYSPRNPFQGKGICTQTYYGLYCEPVTLADVAMYYWDHDLRGDLSNTVPVYMPKGAAAPYTSGQFYDPKYDPADWQHMVTFTIGLGVNGLFDPNTDLPALTNGSKHWASGN
ncbi:MAG TPA: hypothetical protein VKA14_07850, partial [Gammaproteobacteria bacterium]|nr:hypothetical protein [Gammaproteobacteria bacterium]